MSDTKEIQKANANLPIIVHNMNILKEWAAKCIADIERDKP